MDPVPATTLFKSRPVSLMWILGITLFISIIYRAITLSFTVDEAFTFNLFTSQGWKRVVAPHFFDANNHVLFTLFSLGTKTPLGWSEPILRLPSVVAGGFTLVLLMRICRRLLGDSWKAALCYAVPVTNPLLLDHLSIARGYGCAIAFFCGAVWFLIRCLDEPKSSRKFLYGAAWCLALSIACNLTFLFPAAALIICFVLLRRSFAELMTLGQPLVFMLLLLMAIPMRHAVPEDFYFGKYSLRGTLNSLLEQSFYPLPSLLPGLADAETADSFFRESGLLLVILVLAATSLLGTRNLLRKSDNPEQPSTLLLILFPALIFILISAHYVAGVRYPLLRTGLILIVLALLSLSALWSLALSRPLAHRMFTILLLLIAAGHVHATRLHSYGEWKESANVRDASRFLQTLLPTLPEPQKLCVSWVLEPSWNYYIRRHHLPLPEIKRHDRKECTLYDFIPEDVENNQIQNGRVIYTGPISGTSLILIEENKGL